MSLRLHIYLVDDWHGEPTNVAPEEHDEIKWITAGEAADLDLAHSSYVEMVQRALA